MKLSTHLRQPLREEVDALWEYLQEFPGSRIELYQRSHDTTISFLLHFDIINSICFSSHQKNEHIPFRFQAVDFPWGNEKTSPANPGLQLNRVLNPKSTAI
jgi:hypothetical protein